MAVSDAHGFPGSHTAQFSSQSHNYFPHMLQWREAKKAGKKVHLKLVSNSQTPGHESETLTTEPPWRACPFLEDNI